MAASRIILIFPSFPTFPVEIRLKFWKLGLLKPQIIQIHDTSKHPDLLIGPSWNPCHVIAQSSVMYIHPWQQFLQNPELYFYNTSHFASAPCVLEARYNLPALGSIIEYESFWLHSMPGLDTFVNGILKTPDRNQMASWVMDVHWAWPRFALTENYHKPGFPELYSFFDSSQRSRSFWLCMAQLGRWKEYQNTQPEAMFGADSLTTNQARRAHLQITQVSQISPSCQCCKEKWVSYGYRPGCCIRSWRSWLTLIIRGRR